MIKEFEISDILNAVDNISEMEKKKDMTRETKNDSTNKDDVLTLNNQVKSHKSKILVLDQMIEQNIEAFNQKKLNDYRV